MAKYNNNNQQKIHEYLKKNARQSLLFLMMIKRRIKMMKLK
jgi:hypothetical protein